jgi:hypothetical protein
MSIVSSRGSDQFPIRLPDGVRDEIKRAAKASGRSMNSEIVSRIISPPAMTLRDWFAGQALAGIMASPAEVTGKTLAEAHQKAADICYSAADAMLAAREPKT